MFTVEMVKCYQASSVNYNDILVSLLVRTIFRELRLIFLLFLYRFSLYFNSSSLIPCGFFFSPTLFMRMKCSFIMIQERVNKQLGRK